MDKWMMALAHCGPGSCAARDCESNSSSLYAWKKTKAQSYKQAAQRLSLTSGRVLCECWKIHLINLESPHENSGFSALWNKMRWQYMAHATLPPWCLPSPPGLCPSPAQGGGLHCLKLASVGGDPCLRLYSTSLKTSSPLLLGLHSSYHHHHHHQQPNLLKCASSIK